MTTVDTARVASDPARSPGRRFPEPESATRSVFQRDRDRILHCRAFRRLMHKTQVFVTSEFDHMRTRLTHTLEVVQVARSVARCLGLNEDLTEAVALSHDLGHPPFGHCGEGTLDKWMKAWGGFDHNVQTFRIVTSLEARYAGFDGLNLSWDTIEGIVKHNGPIRGAVPPAIRNYCAVRDLEVATHAGPEAQVAGVADDIAYNGHDIDDGLRAGLITLDDLAGVPVAGEAAARVAELHGAEDSDRQAHETVRRIIDFLVGDLIAESRRRIAEDDLQSADEVRRSGRPTFAFSKDVGEANEALKDWLLANVYNHERIRLQRRSAADIVSGLFRTFRDDPMLLPPDWTRRLDGRDETGRMRVVADYIAGMTDRFAGTEYRRLTGGPQ